MTGVIGGRGTWILLAALGLSGCAGLQPVAGPAAEPSSTEERTAQRPTGIEGGPAVVALLDRAHSELAQGRPARSDAALARALRIEPRNPWIWQRMAALRLKQDQPAQAESFALKSNSLAGGNPALQARNWAIIGTARSRQGDAAGAREAESRAAALSGKPG